MKRRDYGQLLEPMDGLEGAPTPDHKRRLLWLFTLFAIAFIVLGGRLAMLHLTPGDLLKQENAFHDVKMEFSENRGEIFDRNGVVLATNKPMPSLEVDPRRVKDTDRLADYLSQKLAIRREEVYQALTFKGTEDNPRRSNPIKRHIETLSEPDFNEILKMGAVCSIQEHEELYPALEADLKGAPSPEMLKTLKKTPPVNALMRTNETLRTYPHGETAAHILGYVQYTGEAKDGVELAFNKYLACQPGVIQTRVDNSRRVLPSGTTGYTPPKGGDLLQLTLDLNIQHTLEAALDQRMVETEAKAAMGIIMDPDTGAILAMATRPAYDPNNYNKYDLERCKNRAVIDVFEPGSVFKVVTASAALETGLITPQTMIDCEGGYFNPYGHRIKDYHKMGVEPFHTCFAMSSNIAMIKVGAMLGPERLDDWIRRFGFGRKTSPDFTMESRGLFQPRKKGSKLTMGSLPMGQEISVTMPQLAQAYAVVANGGLLVEPYVVERAVARDGWVTYQHQAPPPKRLISEETAGTMQELAHEVVLHGTGTTANIMEYRVGGKTGTAQIAKLGGGGYEQGKYTTVFTGFAPIADPRLVAVIVVQEPMNKLRYGGYVCGPVFKQVMSSALSALSVPKDPVTDPEVVAAWEKQQKLNAPKEPKKKKEDPKKAPEPPVIPKDPLTVAQSEAADNDADTVAPPLDPATMDESLAAMISPLDPLELVARRTGDKMETSMPDLAGMTKRQARERLQQLGIPLDSQGAGWVVGQDPPPGTNLADVTVCALRFERKGVKEEVAKDGAQQATTM